MDLIRELWLFLKIRKKYWMIPLFALMLLLGALIGATKGSAVGVFIYTLF